MKIIIEIIIWKWLKLHNYLFNKREIGQLAGMIADELSKWDWADMDPDDEQNIVERIIKEMANV